MEGLSNRTKIRTRIALPTKNKFILTEIENLISDGHGGLDFNILVPMPKEIESTYDESYVSALGALFDPGAKWRYENWGCNWKGDELKFDFSYDKGCFIIFDTVDKAPLGWIEAFCEYVCHKYKLESCGEYVPDYFNKTEMGSFYTTRMGEFVHMDYVESEFDDPAREIQRLWEIDEQELIEWRGVLDLPRSHATSETEEECPSPPPSYSRPKPTIESLKRGLIQFIELWISRW